jgi:N-acetylneuraminate synthase
MKTYFIADIAANHDGQIKRALELCKLAKQSGADAVKFQHFKAETIVSKKGFESLKGQKSHQSNWEKSVFEIYNDASVPLDWTKEIKSYCDELKIDFFTTPYDINYVDELDKYVNMYKIGSGDITWKKMLLKIASKGKKVMIATGASSIYEVKRAMDLLMKFDIPIVLMQCNTNYTASDENFKFINLNVLKTYSNLYPNVELGLSDHTFGHETVLGAVTLGARYIEKHFTDDNNREGPDHLFSMNPNTWKAMVESTRRIEYALGETTKKVEENEKDTVIIQRRSIRSNKTLNKGHAIKESDLIYLRPCSADALDPFEDIIGRVVKKEIRENDEIKLGDLK